MEIMLKDALMTIFKYCMDNYEKNTELLNNYNSEKDSTLNVDDKLKKMADDISKQIQGYLDEKINREVFDIKQKLANEKNNSEISEIKKSVNEIKESVNKITSNNEDNINKILQRVENIGNEFDSIQKINDEMIGVKQQLKNEREKNEKLNSEIKNINEKYESDLQKYSDLKEISNVWYCVKSLNDVDKNYIERLCGKFDVLSVLSLGRDKGKINQLWEYLRDSAVKADADIMEINKLNSYFEFCINLLNSTKSENEKYDICDIEIGSEFDFNLCTKTEGSNQIGNISSVLTKCIKSDGKVEFKAIVKVE